MKIWWVNHGHNEYTVFDLDSILLSISGYDREEDEDKYNYLDSSFSKINFPLYPRAEKSDISSVFWNYVPTDQKSFVKQNLVKTIFN